MKVKIRSDEYNPLLKRREVAFEVDHSDVGGTPSRLEVKKTLASLLKTNLELVYVKRMETKTGLMVAMGAANAYDSVEQAKLVEPEYIATRNLPPEKPEKETSKQPLEKVKETPEESVEKPDEKKRKEG